MAKLSFLSPSVGLCLLICISSSVLCQELDGLADSLRVPKRPYDPCQVVRCGFAAVCRSYNGVAKCVQITDLPESTSSTTRKASDCPSACPAIYKPVCGSDGKKYSNGCQMGIAACKQGKVIEQVPCESITTTTRSPCRAGCPKIALPVCGSDGVTYNNECLLEYARCNGKDVEVCHKGRCEIPICPEELDY